MKIAILHEMLVKFGGAEKVVESFLEIFPEADLFTLIYDEKKMWTFFPKEKINSQVFSLPTQKRYNLFKNQRLCLPLMAKSVEQLDFSEYDLVLCSSSGFAHWAITKPETKFIVYYHSPSRYLWDWTNEYKKDIWFSKWIKWFLLNRLFLKLRIWDYIASNRCDIRIANSKNTQNRIKKYYKKDSVVLYPWVDTARFWNPPPSPLHSKEGEEYNSPPARGELEGGYYIIISALTEFKKIDIAIEWFNKLTNDNLIVIWWWNYEETLKKQILWDNIKLVWPKYWDELVSLVQNSSWLIFPWEEDFWIVPIEVMAAWKPVFAYNWWWLKESVISWITWEFFDNKDWDDFVEKFEIFNKNNLDWKYKSENCKKQAEKFSIKEFERKLREIIKTPSVLADISLQEGDKNKN